MDPSSSKRRPWLRWALLVPLLLVVVVAVCEWQRWPFLRGPLERRLSQTLDRDVSLGPGFGVRLLGPVRLQTDELSIGPPRQGPFRRGEPGAPDDFLSARDAALVLSWKTLLGLRDRRPEEPIPIRSLDVARLDLVLMRRADGIANWQSGAPRREPAEPLTLPEFDRLVVRDATVRVDDAKTDLQLDARISTREGTGVSAAGAGTPAASGASGPEGAGGAAPEPAGSAASPAAAASPPSRASAASRASPASRAASASRTAPRSGSSPASRASPAAGASSAPRQSAAAGSSAARTPPTASAGVDASGPERAASGRAATASGPAPAALAPGATGLQARASGHYGRSTVQAELATSGLLPLVGNDADAPPLPFELRLRMGAAGLELAGQARDVARLAALDARFRLDGPSLAAVGDAIGVTLPSTAPFDMRGRIRRDGTRWRADVASLAVGSSRLAGEFSYDRAPKPPLLTGALRGERLNLPDLAPAFGHAPGGSASAPARPASGPARAGARQAGPPAPGKRAAAKEPAASGPQRRVLPQRPFDTPSLAAMDADVRIALQRADLGTDQVASLAPLNGHLRLKNQVLTIDNLLASASGGELRGSVSMDAREKVPVWSGDLRWAGVRLERFVKARPVEPVDRDKPGAPNSYVSGVFGGNAKLRGRGNSTAAMLGSLDGETNGWVRDGRISHLLLEVSGIDLAESLGVVLSGSDETLPVGCAVTRLAFKDGVAKLEAGVIDTRDTTLLVSGGLSLADETLGLDVRARPKDYSLAALRSPVHIRGSFAEPQVGVDKRPIALRLGAAAALGALIGPMASVLALIDLGEEEKAVCQKALQEMAGTGAPQAPGKAPRDKAAPKEKATPKQ
jgi:uncharacterized protein involved in outer membrane biogenesis